MALGLLHTGLSADQYFFDHQLEVLLQEELGGIKGTVPKAMRYGVLGSAQRIRPIISMRLARLLDTPLELVVPLATSVELLHCASLIVDDLPCMDDAPFRRNQPSVHIQYGEATSVLAAFSLVALAARIVVERETPREYEQRVQQFQLQLLRTLDCTGLVGGQAMDLQLAQEPNFRPSLDISELKTVPLFTLAVSAGSVFADLNSNEQALLNCFGREYGLAFQMTDDLLDGETAEREILNEKLSTLRAVIAPFGQASRHLEELVDYLDDRVSGRPTHA